MDSIYERTQRLDPILYIPSRVAIIGLGGVGTWVALYAAMSGVQNLDLLDPDTLELSNLNRLPFSPETVGQHKVEVVAEWLSQLRPDSIIIPYVMSATPSVLSALERPNILFDCTDRATVQNMIEDWCRATSTSYIRAGYDGYHMTVTSKNSRWGEGGDEGYTIAPSWVCPASAVASLAVTKGLASEKMEFNDSILNLGRSEK